MKQHPLLLRSPLRIALLLLGLSGGLSGHQGSFGLLSAQTFSFSNDALTWDFLPEWDDFLTYRFALESSFGNWNTSLAWNSCTDRALSPGEEGRIDVLEAAFSRRWSPFPVSSRWGRLFFDFGLTGRSFGDLGGLYLQEAWHGSIEVHRPVPQLYDAPLQQLALLGSIDYSGPLPLGPGFPFALFGEISGEAAVPGELQLQARGGLEADPSLLPLQLSGGYLLYTTLRGEDAWTRSRRAASGPFLESRLDFWPLGSRNIFHFAEPWGLGSISLTAAPPGAPPARGVLFQYTLSRLNHNGFGHKVQKAFVIGYPLALCYSALTYRTFSGWLDADLPEGAGGRYGSISIGFEQGVNLPLGALLLDIYLTGDLGIEQRRIYRISLTRMVPEQTLEYLLFEPGAGLRLRVPFFHQRRIGIGLELSLPLDLLVSRTAGPESDDFLSSVTPAVHLLRFALSAVVSDQ